MKDNFDIIKSPLNYTGNKYRIIPQIRKFFPKKIDVMVDMFCGGATVGLNIPCKKVYFVDNNKRVIGLLKFLANEEINKLLENIDELIEKYGLSNSHKYGYHKYREQCKNKADNNGLKDYNKDAYYKLRNDYNGLKDKDTKKANLMLYVLMVYAFNNDIRFNAGGEFNLPIGKTDFNKMNYDKLVAYSERIKNITAEFICADFDSKIVKEITKEADFVYMDPPYLIGDAVYNISWTNETEYKLLDYIDYIRENNINFALSNVLEKVGRKNEPLSYWCYKNEGKIEIHDIDYHYRSASYNKINRNAKEREILIVNKKEENGDK